MPNVDRRKAFRFARKIKLKLVLTAEMVFLLAPKRAEPTENVLCFSACGSDGSPSGSRGGGEYQTREEFRVRPFGWTVANLAHHCLSWLTAVLHWQTRYQGGGCLHKPVRRHEPHHRVASGAS